MTLALFDVDGTLVDTNDGHAHAWQRALHEHGFDFDFARVRGQIGKGGDQLLPALLTRPDQREKAPLIEKRHGEIFKSEFLPRARAFPGVRQLFEALRERGVQLMLASSGEAEEVAHYVGLLGVIDLLSATTTHADAAHSKPAPDIFLAALYRAPGTEVRDVVVIGDTPYDASAARKSGMTCIGVMSGGFHPAELSAAGCTHIYNDVADLHRRLDESPLAGHKKAR